MRAVQAKERRRNHAETLSPCPRDVAWLDLWDALGWRSDRGHVSCLLDAGGKHCRYSCGHASMPTISAGFLPAGLQFLGQAWSEPVLMKLAYAYEQATKHRHPPASAPTRY